MLDKVEFFLRALVTHKYTVITHFFLPIKITELVETRGMRNGLKTGIYRPVAEFGA